jgi:hypothetical protein
MKIVNFTLSILLLCCFLFTQYSEAQVSTVSKKWKSPFLTIETAGSVDLPIQDASGEIGDFFRFQNYGTSIGWGGQFNFKFGLGPKGTYRPYIFLGYAQLQGSNSQYAFIGTNYINNGYPLPGNGRYGDSTNGSSTIVLRIPYVGLGFEYAFTEVDRKKRQFIPFIGVDFFMDIITGMYRQTQNPAIVTGGDVETPYTIKTDVRLGIGAGTGADVRFTPNFGMTFGFKYKFANLIGKKSDFLREDNKMNLLDAAAPNLNNSLANSRNIGFLEFYLGAAFYIGNSKK